MRRLMIGLATGATLLVGLACTAAVNEVALSPAADSGEVDQVDSQPPAVSQPAQSPATSEKPATVSNLDPVFSAQLTDVGTGESYSIAEINQGKVIVIDIMAIWCVTCRAQAVELKRAVPSWGDQVEVIMLDVDPSEDADMLKAYGEQQKYTWKLSLSPREISLKLRNQFGPTVLNNTLVPLIVIDRQGEMHRLRNGVKPVDEILAEVGKFL